MVDPTYVQWLSRFNRQGFERKCIYCTVLFTAPFSAEKPKPMFGFTDFDSDHRTSLALNILFMSGSILIQI